ncbi:MAG: branched-chain amino acid ABC transporter permease [Ruminococcaceae bacterium]|nr:branched-chain amino acid ABC transporter permease [Oscillospiraceae bacterium]
MKKWKNLSSKTRSDFLTYTMVIVAFIVLRVLSAFGMLSNSLTGLLVPLCAYIIMAVSLNLTVGVLGELSLGHAGFMSVGAFSGVIACAGMESFIPNPILRLVIAVVIGGILAGITGFLIGIPVLRLRGDYLAIVTLAFGEIIKNIINCLYIGIDGSGLHFSLISSADLALENGRVVINGPVGAVGVQKLSTFTFGFVLVMLTLIVVLNLKRSRTGRAIMAVRDNRIAAESVGISITKYKMIAFITSAVMAGAAGVLFAMNYTSLTSSKFDFNQSILILVFVVLGGLGNIRGSIIATVILYLLPEILRPIQDYRMLIYSIVLIVVMLTTNSEKAKLFIEKQKAKLKEKKEKGGAKGE